MLPTYLLTCVDTPDRYTRAREQLLECGLHDAISFYGFYGPSLGLRPWHWQHPKGFRLSQGGLGCALSHMALWQHLAATSTTAALVLEDDFCLHDRFLSYISPDWHQVPTAIESVCAPVLRGDLQFCYLGWIMHGDLPLGTHSYVVHQSAIPILLSACCPIKFGVDVMIAENALPLLKWDKLDDPMFAQRTQTGEWPSLTRG